MTNVIFSFQGSFGPPTLGHLMCMFSFAQQIQKDYGDGNKTMLFMPAAGGSKSHLFPTRLSRVNLLRVFCKILSSHFPDINFDVSDIEYNIAGSSNNKSVATIHTIRKLHELKVSETDEICLGMGLDNAYQLPLWESIDQYTHYVRKIYIVHRDPINADAPSANHYFDKESSVHFTLPTIVEIPGDIPPTSSTILRNLIAEGNREEEVKNIIFGPHYAIDYKDALDEIIKSYKSI